MESQNLSTASNYVNNLLLSRGLLRNGTPIEFAKPSKGEGGKDATMTQIINLVHDLVLRRDRETETLSTLSQNMQSLRATSAQYTQHIARLEVKNSDLDRQLAFAVSQERTSKASLRTAEIRNRVLREEMSRLKLTVSQVRSQCANDIRKRDGEIKRLKRHLEGRRGREGNGGQVGVVVVTPTLTKGKNGNILNNGVDVEFPSYSLKEETTDFLTQLSQSLSNENEALISLVRSSLATLRSLQGLPDSQRDESRWATENEHLEDDPNVFLSMTPPYETLAANMDRVLENLRGLLTNPSFVPLEEVEIREDEILRLREGWEKMEARWREALSMMDGWRKRMMETGDTINLDDLRQGLNLAAEDIRLPESESDESLSEIEGVEDSLNSDADIYLKGASLSAAPDAGPSNPVKRSGRDSGAGLFPAPKILREASGNVQRSPSPRKVSFHTASKETAGIIDDLDEADELAMLDLNSSPPLRKTVDCANKPTKLEKFWESPMTVQQKLENAQLEAEMARKNENKKITVKRTSIPRKIKNRRRSTLSPEELEGLMGV